jgi:hypothetical protein
MAGGLLLEVCETACCCTLQLSMQAAAGEPAHIRGRAFARVQATIAPNVEVDRKIARGDAAFPQGLVSGDSLAGSSS